MTPVSALAVIYEVSWSGTLQLQLERLAGRIKVTHLSGSCFVSFPTDHFPSPCEFCGRNLQSVVEWDTAIAAGAFGREIESHSSVMLCFIPDGPFPVSV
jgi:hypothetical protein